MIFDKESDFEEAVIGVLVERGWEPEGSSLGFLPDLLFLFSFILLWI